MESSVYKDEQGHTFAVTNPYLLAYMGTDPPDLQIDHIKSNQTTDLQQQSRHEIETPALDCYPDPIIGEAARNDTLTEECVPTTVKVEQISPLKPLQLNDKNLQSSSKEEFSYAARYAMYRLMESNSLLRDRLNFVLNTGGRDFQLEENNRKFYSGGSIQSPALTHPVSALLHDSPSESTSLTQTYTHRGRENALSEIYANTAYGNMLANPWPVPVNYQRAANSLANYNMWKCDLCSKTFVSMYRLNYHRGSHFRISCSICGQRCIDSDSLWRHYLSHVNVNQKPYQCPVCLKWFPQKSYLKQHLKIHSREKKEN